jgi:fructose-specific phosphotransferase system IIC component
MIENSLKNIEGIEIFPIISLLIFVSFFIVLVVWFLKSDNKHLTEMGNLPLDSTNEKESTSTGKYYEK